MELGVCGRCGSVGQGGGVGGEGGWVWGGGVGCGGLSQILLSHLPNMSTPHARRYAGAVTAKKA